MNRIKNLAKKMSTQTCSAGDVIFTGVTCTDGQNPAVSFKTRDCLNNADVEISIFRSNLTPQNLEKTIVENNGLCMDAKSVCENLIKDYELFLKQNWQNISRTHTRLGWQKNQDEIVFYGQNAISKGNVVKSEYVGDIDIKPVGNLENVTQMIQTQIIDSNGWCAMEAVVAFGVAATVLPYVNLAWNHSLDNKLLHLMGGSTTGKTTALVLFSGFGSNPNPKKGYWVNYASTEGSIIKKIGYNYGCPVSIDELSMGRKKEYDRFVYTIGNGEEKDRLKSGGIGLQEAVTYQIIVLSSGEESLYRKCSKKEGIRVRCIEFANVKWTKSKEQSEAIKECMKMNHALVTEKVAQELIDNDEKWKARWDFWQQRVAKMILKKKVRIAIGGRISDYVALFALSAEIANVVLNIKLNIEAIFHFCYKYIIVANLSEASLAESGYAAIGEYISNNRNKFGDGTVWGGVLCTTNEIILSEEMDGCYIEAKKGRWINGELYELMYIFKRGAIEDILIDAGFSEPKVVLNKLREDKYLKVKDKARNTYPCTINGVEQNCVVVFFKNLTYKGFQLPNGMKALVGDMN